MKEEIIKYLRWASTGVLVSFIFLNTHWSVGLFALLTAIRFEITIYYK